MKLLLIFSPILLALSINASIQKLTNPILPLSLRKTRIISSKHTFVTYMNLTELTDIRNNLESQLNFVILKENLGSHTYNLMNQANALLSYVDYSLKIIYPYKRPKRGLINLGGKISKWLFGTLDADDGKRIDSVLNHLNKNDHLLQEKINEQITLAKDIMAKTNHSLSQIKSNMLIIGRSIDQFSEQINDINTLNLIINSLFLLHIHLNEIINAMTFANFNRIHPTFLSLENLHSLNEKINTIYSSDQLVQFINYIATTPF